jgi:hypothetical protein
MIEDSLLPDEKAVLHWIELIHAQGIRRPGYPADRWAEQFLCDQLRGFGVENVRLEPVELPYWEPRRAILVAESDKERLDIDCFPCPFSAPVQAGRFELAAFDDGARADVRGKASLYDVTLTRLPPTFTVQRRPMETNDGVPARIREAGFVYDPRATMKDAIQVLPFGLEIQHVMEPSIDAGAAAFVGVLRDYPGGGHDYYVPYDGIVRAIPGVWIRERDGVRLRDLLKDGKVSIDLSVEATCEPITSHNVVGELPGADDEWVIVGTHHDGPWSSAVEDGSGMALVLAQAAYWSRVPPAQRPHRLVFLVNAGHMAGSAGANSFIERHRAELDRVVLEIHLEHTAREFVERDGSLAASGEPEPRWWFTSRNAELEQAVWNAIESENLERSLLMTPDAIAPIPTTDGGPFHAVNVPLVNFLTAPFYLFDRMDNMDKIDAPSLLPVTKATVRIIESTRNISASAMRAGVRQP